MSEKFINDAKCQPPFKINSKVDIISINETEKLLCEHTKGISDCEEIISEAERVLETIEGEIPTEAGWVQEVRVGFIVCYTKGLEAINVKIFYANIMS